MSATLETIDLKTALSNWLNGLVHMYTSDINPIPQDKWAAGFGGCTRNAGDLTADAISLLEWTTKVLNAGGTTEGIENYMAANKDQYMTDLKAACSTKEGAASRLKSAAENFNQALAATSDDTLTKNIMAPWGMETPLYMIAQVSVSHIWYHDGQLNYIQCLLGDDKVHWMGD